MNRMILRQNKNQALATLWKYDAPYFGILQHVKDNIYRPLPYISTCREVLLSNIKGHIAKGNINPDQINLFVMNKKIFAKQLGYNSKELVDAAIEKHHNNNVCMANTSLRILNIIERNMNWNRTVLYELKHRSAKDNDPFMFVMSRGWSRSPFSLSLGTLFCRLSRYPQFKKARGMKSLSRELSAFSELRTNDSLLIKDILGHWKTFLKHQNEIFEGFSPKELFDMLTGGTYGINKFIKNDVTKTFKPMAERFNRIKEVEYKG